MIVTYNTAPTVASTTLGIGSSTGCTTGANRAFVESLTPTFRGTATDGEGDKTGLTVEIYALGSSALVANGTTDAAAFVAPGAAASWTAPAGKLSNGSAYRWRAKATDGTFTSPTWSPMCEFAVNVPYGQMDKVLYSESLEGAGVETPLTTLPEPGSTDAVMA